MNSYSFVKKEYLFHHLFSVISFFSKKLLIKPYSFLGIAGISSHSGSKLYFMNKLKLLSKSNSLDSDSLDSKSEILNLMS